MISPTVIDVTGSNTQIGTAIAEGTSHLRDDLAQVVAEAVEDNPLSHWFVRDTLDQMRSMMEGHSPGTLEQVDAMADRYRIPANDLLTWLLGTYFHSANAGDDGCSVCAWSGSPGLVGGTWLAKNRDSSLHLQHLQTILRVTPLHGHPWAALSTAGAPGVHSAGMNSHGLAIADTHVPSRDVGIGLPRFTLMRHILERCTTVAEAVTYLRNVPRMGFGNLVLADPDETAAIECAHSRVSLIDPTHGYSSATNHFVSAGLDQTCWYTPESVPGQDSRARHRNLQGALSSAARHEACDPVKMLSSHRGPGQLCVHPTDAGHATIATIIFLPRQRLMRVGIGTPCTSRMQTISVAAKNRA